MKRKLSFLCLSQFVVFPLLLCNMNNFNYSTKNIYYGHSLFSIWHVFYDSSRETTIIEVGGAYYGFIDELQKTASKGDTIAFSKNGYLVCKNNKLFYTNKHLKTTFKLKEYNRTEKKEQLRRKIFSDYFGQFIKENQNTKIEHMTYMEFRNNMNIPTNCIEYLKDYYNSILNSDKETDPDAIE